MRVLYRFLILAVFMLTGCGFHLRGIINADSIKQFHSIAIIIQQVHRDLEPLLKNQLKAYKITVTTDPTLAQYWLILEHEEMHQNVTSISSSTTPRQYELTYTLDFKLQRAKGAEVIPTSTIVVTRQITLNSDRILGSKYEEETQKNEMRREAVLQLLYRLSRASLADLNSNVLPTKHH